MVRVFCFVVLLLSTAIVSAGNPAEYQDGAESTGLIQRSCIVQMHRAAMECRKQRRMQRQALSEECCKIAQEWAEKMAASDNMRHGGGEQVIARGYKTPSLCISAWMRSSGHRRWLLSNRKYAGWGCAQSKSGTWYWAGCFRSQVKVPACKDCEE